MQASDLPRRVHWYVCRRHLAFEDDIQKASGKHRSGVLPSGMEIIPSDGSFAMRPQTKRHGFSHVLTIFLDSLSKSGHPGVAVILSGVDADGAAALKASRQRGGITIAQEPGTAERAAMPISAIQTGVVDDVLPPEAIAGKLEQLARQFRGSAA